MRITRTALHRMIVSEVRRISERGDVEGFSDLADRTPAYDALVDAAQAAMAEDGKSFDQLIDMLRADVA